jgi:hypothetical protein
MVDLKENELAIKYKPDGYYTNGNKISISLIEILIKVIIEPEVVELNLDDWGITRTWLNNNVIPDFKGFYLGADEPTLAQKALYIKSFTNLTIMKRVLERYYKNYSSMDDDYPEVSIIITGTNGEEIKIFSDFQGPFMIPWQISIISKNVSKIIKTYNIHISKAIWAILPDGFLNLTRINGTARPLFKKNLIRFLYYEIEDGWNKLGMDTQKSAAMK